MNFYNEDEKKDGAAAPAAFKKTSSFGKAPLFSRTAGGLMDRLKNLSRKDMAFVGIGLSVLVMAPVAEYMMSKPSSDNLLTPGFGSREGGAPTGLYEPGINALSQGSPDGSGEVITPLSSRDPASLILGSQPAAPAMPPPAPPTTFRDSMKDVGRAAFSEASKAAPSPTPIPRMQAALRGMSSFFGGGDSTRTSGSLGGGKIIDDAKSASSKAAKRSMVGPVAMPGYKGVASNTPNSSSKGAFEKLRSAADKSAGNFSGGSAMSSLDKAAADAPTVGAGGGGMGYGGDSEKTGKTSPYNNKYEHSRSGESLAEMAAKQRMQKALDWEFFKQYEIPKMFINAIITGITGPLTKMVEGSVKHVFGMDDRPKERFCWSPANDLSSTKPMDCVKYGAIGESFLTDSGEKQSSTQIPPGRSCVCGFNSVKPTVPGCNPASALVDTPANPEAGAGNPPPTSASFDAVFITVLQRIQEAVKKGDGLTAKDILAYNQGISGTLAGEMPKLAGTLNTSVQGVNALLSGDISKLANENVKALSPLMAAESEIEAFIKDVKAAMVSPEAAKKKGEELTADKEVKAQLDTSEESSYSKDLRRYLERAESMKTTRLVSARNHLGFNEKSQKFYVQQGQTLVKMISAHRDTAFQLAEKAKKISDEADAVKTEEAEKNLDAVCKQFADLSGVKLTVCKNTPAPEAGSGLADQVLKLRGAEGVKDNALDDKKVLDAEAAAWKAGSPKVKLDNDTIAQQAETMDPPQDNIAACLRRANVELPPDVAVLVVNPEKSVAGPARSVSSDIKEFRKSLFAAVTPGTPPAEPPAPSVPPATPPAVQGLGDVSDKAANLAGDMAPEIADAQKRYDMVLNSGRCTSDACKQHLSSAAGNLSVMRKYSEEVGKLQGELKPGITAERLGQVKERLGQIQTSMNRNNPQSEPRRFDENIKKAADLAKVPTAVAPNPQPVPPVQPAPKPKPTVDQQRLNEYRAEIRARNQRTREKKDALRVSAASLATAQADFGNRAELCKHFTGLHQSECVNRLQAAVSAAARKRNAAAANLAEAQGSCETFYKGLPSAYKKFILVPCEK